MEAMIDYVARKLNEPYINVLGVSKETNVSRATIYRIAKGSQHSNSRAVETLHNFFRKINE